MPARRLAVRLRARVTVPLLPKRALVLAQEILTRGVQAIKADSWDAMYEQAAPQRGPDLGATAK